MAWFNTRAAMGPLESLLQHINDVNSFGKYIETVPMYPVFQVAHFVLISFALRSREGSYDFAKKHPLSSWFVNLVSCYGGSIIQNFLLAQPIMLVLKDERNFITASVIWYFVFFSPCDVVWKFIQLNLSKALLRILKEVHRLRMIQNGLNLASTLHPDSWLIIIIIGAVKGSGAKFIMKPLDHMVRGELISTNELLQPHFATKSALIISAILYYESFSYINIPKHVLVVCLYFYMVFFQLAFLFTKIKDPYLYAEKIVFYIFVKLPKDLFSKELESKKSKTE